MFDKQYQWKSGSVSSKTESVWTNIFTISEDALDFRFNLTGYGWKENSSIENKREIQSGIYKCYYRKQGESDWIHFTTVICGRDDSEKTNVYRDAYVFFSFTEYATWEVKIVATKGELFTSWGGVIEGISSGEQFWSNLEVRA